MTGRAGHPGAMSIANRTRDLLDGYRKLLADHFQTKTRTRTKTKNNFISLSEFTVLTLSMNSSMEIRVAIMVIISAILCLATIGFIIYIGFDVYYYDKLNSDQIISISDDEVTYSILNRTYISSVDIYENHICCKYDPNDPSKLYSVNEDRELALFILPLVALVSGFISYAGIKYPDKLAPWIADYIDP